MSEAARTLASFDAPDWNYFALDYGAHIRWREDSRAQGILSEPIRVSADRSTRILSFGAFVVSWAALIVAVLR